MKSSALFIPALRYRILTPVYDAMQRVFAREDVIKPAFVDLIAPHAMERILDVGCGTGTLLALMKTREQGVALSGIDVDEQILAIAREKLRRKSLTADIVNTSATELPFQDGVFDKVVTSLVLHHLSTELRMRALHEMRRVLVPNGKLFVTEFAPPHTMSMRFVSSVIRHFEEVKDFYSGRFPDMLTDVGFRNVSVVHRFRTPIGAMAFYRAEK